MLSIDPIRPYLNAIKAGAFVVALLLVWWHGFDTGRDRWQEKFDTEKAAHVATKSSHAGVLRDLANKTKAAEDAVKAAVEKAKADRKAADQRFKEATDEAAKARTALARALRDGSVRLREEWTCPAAGPAEGGAAATAGRQDANADLRAEGAADLVAAGKAADNWIVWLQSELISTRTACGVSP